MKKILKLLSVCLALVCCVVVSGCSCSSPMNVSYKISTADGTDLDVQAIVMKKFREPTNTPCYKKIEGNKHGYSKLETSEEIQACFEGKIKCYKKEGFFNPEYIEITSKTELNRCEDEFDCYEKVDATYYKLLEDPEGIAECYTAEGEPFERATYEKAESVELENKRVLSSEVNRYVYSSSKEEVPSNANYSLIYTFTISNKDSKTMYVEAIEYNDLTQGVVKEASSNKVKLTLPQNRVFMDNKFYYVLPSGSQITIKIEIKNLLTSDSIDKKTKNLEMVIPVTVRYN